MQLSVKNVSEKTFQEFKAEVVREGLDIGPALTLAMETWLEAKSKRKAKSFFDFKPHIWKTKNVTDEIDEVVYSQ